MRVWGEVEDRLGGVMAGPGPAGTGLRIEGLPPGRERTSADRIRAAMINSKLIGEVPALVLRLEPQLRGGPTAEMDVPFALAALASTGVVGVGLGWGLAHGAL